MRFRSQIERGPVDQDLIARGKADFEGFPGVGDIVGDQERASLLAGIVCPDIVRSHSVAIRRRRVSGAGDHSERFLGFVLDQ